MTRVTNNYTPEALALAANNSVSVIIHKFSCLIGKAKPDSLICFVEGHDLPYYNSRIESMSGNHCLFVDSGGKKNVVQTYSFFSSHSNYDHHKKLYFVDRDYDDNSGLANDIYVTPCYSVENLCVSKDSFSKLLKVFYNVDMDNPKFDDAISFFNKEVQKVISATRIFCAWYKCVRKMPGQNSVELSESFPSDISKIGPNSIEEINNSLEYINGKYSNVPDVGIIQHNEALQEIGDDLRNIRGKYVFDFIEYIACVLNKDIKGRKKYTEGKNQFEQNRKTLLARLAPFADTPTCLRDYVLRMI